MRQRLLILILLVSLVGCGESVVQPLSVGDSAPNFQLTKLPDDTILNSDSLRGEVTLLTFWSTTCSSCLQEVDLLNGIHQEGTRVVGIAIDDDVARVTNSLTEHQIKYPVLNGNEETFLRFDGFSTPYSLVLDADLVVRKKIIGRVDKESVDAIVESIKNEADQDQI